MTHWETSEELRARVGRLVGRLASLESNDAGSDRATMAALRSGLRHSDGVALEMMPFLSKFLPPQESKRDARWFQVAALFALHPQNTRRETFAQAFRKLADAGSESVEKRFQLLLSCHGDDLFRHLTQCVGLLHAQNISLNWYQLLLDLSAGDWDDPRRTIQMRWAREFYRQRAEEFASQN